MGHDLRVTLWHLMLGVRSPGLTARYETPFQDCGLSAIDRAAVMASVESHYGIRLDARDRWSAVSIEALARVVERKVSSLLLGEGIGPLALLEWSAHQGPSRYFRFLPSRQREVVFEQAEFFAVSAALASRFLRHRIQALGAAESVIVLILAASPFIRLLTFLAALRCGASPVFGDLRARSGEFSPAVAASTLLGRAPGDGVRRLLVVAEQGTGPTRFPVPPSSLLTLPTDPGLYTRMAAAKSDEPDAGALDGVGTTVPMLLRLDRRRGHHGVLTVPPQQLVALGESLADLSPPSTWERIITWHPLSDDIGLAAALLWPVLARRSVTVMSSQLFRSHPQLWLRELGRWPGAIGLAPARALRWVTENIGDREVDRLDLSGLALLATGVPYPADESLTVFADRFEAVGFSPSRFGVDPRLSGWPPGSR